MLNKRLATILITMSIMFGLVACNSNQVSQAPVENKEDVVVSTESISTEQSTEIESTEQEETIWISLTEEQIAGETKPIEYSISYFSLSSEYRAKAEEIFENYIASGMEEEQAVEQAIQDVLDTIYEEHIDYLTDNAIQLENGVEPIIEYDENGYDKALYKWYATDEQEVIDLGAFYVKSGEMTKSEAEQYINDTLQGLAEFYEQENSDSQ